MKDSFYYEVGIVCDCCQTRYPETFDFKSSAEKRYKELIEHFGIRRVFLKTVKRAK
jgi:hypothetical protein